MGADLVRFADFELDSRAYQLRRSGRALKLERIPMEVLCLLVERGGQLVTREEIIEKLWGKDVFLDTDNAINTAIRKIRQALRDDPEQPRFVQTITGRGYRFIALVAEPGTEREAQEREGSARSANPKEVRTGANHRKRWLLVVAATVALPALALAGYIYFHRSPKLTDKDTIVLADFTNTTGDAVFDGTLRQGMAVQLEQSPFLSLVSEERIQQTLRLMGQSPDARLTPELAREICERTASAAVLEGSIASLGSQYVLGLRAKSCQTGDLLDQEQMPAARKEEVLNTLSQMASKFRARVGESLATVQKHDTPLEEATTSSLDALKAYSSALKIVYSTGSLAAEPLFKRATEFDPKFAMAHAWVGRMYDDVGESALSAESTRTAFQLRDRASDAEKLFITASYYMQVTGNMEKAQQTCEAWASTYPRAVVPHDFLSGIIYPAFGKYEKGVEESQKAIERDPDFAVGYLTLAYSYVYLDRLDEAESTLRKATERKLEMPDYSVLRYDIAFLRDDKAEMARQMSLAQMKPGAEDWIANHQAFVYGYSGKLQEAERMSRKATELALQVGHRERAALYEAGAALREALFGNSATAKQDAMAALELSKGRGVEYGAAIALALSGDLSRAEALTNDLEKRFPEDTSVQFSYLPTLRAVVNLEHGKPSNAIELLQIAAPDELGAPGSSFFGFYGALYPVYFRGEAYLAAHKGVEAAAEFEKILRHRSIFVSDPMGALAHLQLARAYALAGNKTKARSGYQDFFTLWKDADSDIPILRQAKAEYARLQ
ncbi:MAG TPA: winged helix-turn-helix domain-containing protein [Candidatus Acidoferrum sp.]|nr:winged helix-turn-helix domain-containing protein [Candidatus Acidoferrum sp.]